MATAKDLEALQAQKQEIKALWGSKMSKTRLKLHDLKDHFRSHKG
jgi:hypothetical protein